MPSPGKPFLPKSARKILLLPLFLLFNQLLFAQSDINEYSFSDKTSLPVIKGQRGIFSCDLDGDGRSDLIVAHADTNILSVYRNVSVAGAIHFQFQEDYLLAKNDDPYGISAGDLDGDGRPDLVVSNDLTKTISLFKNTSTSGNISFGARINMSGGRTASAATIADCNGDGKPEIIVANSGDFLLSVYRNTSTAAGLSFAAKMDIHLSSYPYGVVAMDLDGDGKPEIATQNYDENTISVFRNTSSGDGSLHFSSRLDFATDRGPVGLRAEDMDGDNKPDLISVNYDAGTVSLLKNTSKVGKISFAAKQDQPIGVSPMGIAIADLDGDGKADLAITNWDNNTVAVLRNTGNPGNISYAAQVDYPTDSIPGVVIAADLDGDGRPDLATANLCASTVALLRNRGASPTAASANAFQLVDFSGIASHGETLMKWQTRYERGAVRFVIQRRNPYGAFAAIDSLQSPGRDSGSQTYAKTDDLPQAGINYYRLRIVDTAGHITFSQVVTVQTGGIAADLVVYPNPTISDLIAVVPGISYSSQFRLIDITGRLLQVVPVAVGTSQVRINMAAAGRGVYKLIWVDGVNTRIQTVVRQ